MPGWLNTLLLRRPSADAPCARTRRRSPHGGIDALCAFVLRPGRDPSNTGRNRRCSWRKAMSFYRGMTCENVSLKGHQGTPITAYVAKPSGAGRFPGVVLIHHLPGWSELYIETTRRFADHGYIAICANLYEREGGGSDGNPDDVAAKVRAEGGIADSQMVGDTEAAVKWMRAQPDCNGKVGLIGSCSGGRHAFIYACQKKDIDACVEQWGGGVVMAKEELNAKKPVAPIDMTQGLSV